MLRPILKVIFMLFMRKLFSCIFSHAEMSPQAFFQTFCLCSLDSAVIGQLVCGGTSVHLPHPGAKGHTLLV